MRADLDCLAVVHHGARLRHRTKLQAARARRALQRRLLLSEAPCHYLAMPSRGERVSDRSEPRLKAQGLGEGKTGRGLLFVVRTVQHELTRITSHGGGLTRSGGGD